MHKEASRTRNRVALNPQAGRLRQVLRIVAFLLVSNVFAQEGSMDDITAFLDIRSGGIPVVISAPHGGERDIPGIPVRMYGEHDIDDRTYQLATGIRAELASLMGGRAPFLVASCVARTYIDFNRAASQAYETEAVAPLYRAYHDALSVAVKQAKAMDVSRAILIDVHGQSRNMARVYRGTQNGKTADNGALYRIDHPGFVSVLFAGGIELWPGEPTGRESRYYNGGFIVMVQGLSGTGGINALQLEFGMDFRDSPEALARTARTVASALAAWLEEGSSTR